MWVTIPKIRVLLNAGWTGHFILVRDLIIELISKESSLDTFRSHCLSVPVITMMKCFKSEKLLRLEPQIGITSWGVTSSQSELSTSAVKDTCIMLPLLPTDSMQLHKLWSLLVNLKIPNPQGQFVHCTYVLCFTFRAQRITPHHSFLIQFFIESSASFMHLRWWLQPLHRVRCWWTWSAWRFQMGCADQSGACGSSSGSDPRFWILHHRESFWWWCAESGGGCRETRF